MILTDKEKMIVTPTYHVFEMYAVHHDARLLPAELQTADYSLGNNAVPTLHVSASKDRSGKIHLTLCNLNPNDVAELTCELRGANAKAITGRVLTAAAINAHNTFDQPGNVKPAVFTGAKVTDSGFTATLPAKSVVVLAIE
jgi:alpha-N-arabinofuranosidase